MSEIALLLPDLGRKSPILIFALMGRSILDQLSVFQLFLLAQVGLSLGAFGYSAAPRLRRALAAAALLIAVLTGWHSYGLLVEYPRFAGYVPFILAWTGMTAYLAWIYIMAVAARWSSPLGSHLARFGVLVAIGTHSANLLLYPGAYPTLHIALFSVTFLLLQAGALYLVRSKRRPVLHLVAGGILLVGFSFADAAQADQTVMPLYRSETVLGQSVAALAPLVESECEPVPKLTHEVAARVFRESSGLPALPQSFDIANYNVLVVMIDTLRSDEAPPGSLHPSKTPALARLVADGAYSFERAYAPSGITLASVASLMSMTYPSHAQLTVRSPRWTGTLRPEARTLAEHFSAVGYATFRSVHGIGRASIFGLDQGFDTNHVVARYNKRAEWDGDSLVADHAIKELRALVDADQKFFGFVFFGGPHAPYVARDSPSFPPRERYRQEVAHTDMQLGRLLDVLRQEGVSSQTIVIVAGDHGEEFGEHGGKAHGATLYEEAIRVPLIVSLPGIRGSLQHRVTSLVHVFPWLLSNSSGTLRTVAHRSIQKHVAPILAATGGGIVAEILGSDRMMSALVYADGKVIYDYITGRYEVYRLDHDAREQLDLVRTEDPDIGRWVARFEAYRNLRACHRAFVVE